ncbi:hypothetical protein ACRQ5Q_39420 [Bradyrhizobium sp. PMVTL-01]|uniref:hypothetical protein n=1 Tax=Bradyrhizobium sp. PMVTL-01 TaxID=3434999 RepID=UPI003F71FDA6
MKYAILALGLLVTPAVAETYDELDCEMLLRMLNNCTIKPNCDPYPTGHDAKGFRRMVEHHPNWWRDQMPTDKPVEERPFNKLCARVCDGKVAPLDVVKKFCPTWRPKS